MAQYIKEFEESRLKFTFDTEHWQQIIQFEEHIDYKNLKKCLSGTKGVDFLGIYEDSTYFFEVKNFKDYRIQNKDRMGNKGEDLMTEVAQKIRDSLACIVSGKRNSTNCQELWSKFLVNILNEKKTIKIVLWLETDNIQNLTGVRQNNQVRRNQVYIFDYKRKLQSKLKWFASTRANVTIMNIDNYRNNLDFKVISLPK